GSAITQWAHVEEALWLVLAACFTADFPALRTAFFSVENFRSRLQLVDKVFRQTFRDKKNIEAWSDLHDRLRSTSSARNALAHYRVVVYPEQPAGRHYALLPRLTDTNSRNPLKPPPGALFVRDLNQ